jgi:hypothetical protein
VDQEAVSGLIAADTIPILLTIEANKMHCSAQISRSLPEWLKKGILKA